MCGSQHLAHELDGKTETEEQLVCEMRRGGPGSQTDRLLEPEVTVPPLDFSLHLLLVATRI